MRGRSGHFGQDVTVNDPEATKTVMDAEQELCLIPAEFEDQVSSYHTIQELSSPDADVDFKTGVVEQAARVTLDEQVGEEVEKKKRQRYLLWGALAVLGMRRFL